MNSVKIFVVGTLLVWRQKWTARPCWVGSLGAHTPLCSPRYLPLGPTVLLGHCSIDHASLLLRLPAPSESLAALESCPSWLLTRTALPCPGPALFPSLWIDYSEFLTDVESYNIWLISHLRTFLSLGRNEASLCFNYSDMWWYFIKDLHFPDSKWYFYVLICLLCVVFAGKVCLCLLLIFKLSFSLSFWVLKVLIVCRCSRASAPVVSSCPTELLFPFCHVSGVWCSLELCVCTTRPWLLQPPGSLSTEGMLSSSSALLRAVFSSLLVALPFHINCQWCRVDLQDEFHCGHW